MLARRRWFAWAAEPLMGTDRYNNVAIAVVFGNLPPTGTRRCKKHQIVT
jgi:hypothetical protein